MLYQYSADHLNKLLWTGYFALADQIKNGNLKSPGALFDAAFMPLGDALSGSTGLTAGDAAFAGIYSDGGASGEPTAIHSKDVVAMVTEMLLMDRAWTGRAAGF